MQVAKPIGMFMIRLGRMVCLLYLLASCGVVRRGVTVLIPDGFVGWVRVEYEVAGAPTLRVDSGRYLITVPKTAFLATASKPESGFGDDEYFYVDDQGRRVQLSIASDNPNDSAIRDRKTITIGAPGKPNRTFRAFFVGTDSAYQRAPKDPTALPLP